MSELTHSRLLSRAIAGEDLSIDEARWAFDRIMDGEWSEAQIAGLLVALATKGESVSEFTGAAQAMRSHVVSVDVAELDIVDTCGTGGTGISTFNISTAAGFVAAGAGVPIAKHGNRTNTRASGSANVLAELGVNLECDPAGEARCLRQANVCFLFAMTHHPAMRFAGPVRKQLGVRTIFNVLGPLTNPAGAKRQVLGVASEALVEPLAGVLRELGAERAMVVHSADGLDEISTTAPATIASLAEGSIAVTTLDATDLGLPRARLEDLMVATAGESARVVRSVLEGKAGPARDITAVNAAAAILVAGKADTLAEALKLAQRSIDSGAARTALEKLVAVSNAT